MSIMQAIMAAALYWYSSVEFPYCLYTLICQPVCSGLITGLILGNPVLGLAVGAAVQLIYLAPTGFGGVYPTDKAAAGIIATCAVITSNISVEAGVVLAVPAGLLFAQLHTIRRLVASVWVQMADRYAEKNNTRGIILAGTLYPTLFKILLFWVPMTLMLYFGMESVGTFVSSLPEWASNGLNVTGKLLPALGFAMTIRMIGRKELMPFFLAGFFIVQYTGLSTMALVLTALFLAYLYITFTKEASDSSASEMIKSFRETSTAGDAENQQLLTRKDISRTWLRWYAVAEMSNSFERLQSLAFCIAFTPVLNKLYKNKPEEKKEALKRHLQFFNTEGNLGAIIHGIALSMEEQRAMGKPISGEAIVGLKTGLMGPFAGIGDTILWATFYVITLATCVSSAASGNMWAPPLWVILFGSFLAIVGYSMTHFGYRLGTKGASLILGSGILQKAITFFAVLGLFMLGGMTSGFVNVITPLEINAGTSIINVQTGIIDAILPGILSLATVLGIYQYLRKGKGNVMLKATLALLVIGLVLGGLGILG